MKSPDQVMIGSATLPKAADPVKWGGIWLMAILIGGPVPSVSRSADYWVGPGGRDREGSGGQRKPWATLQFAADHVKPGDTVHVLDGDYTGFYLNRSGEVPTPIRFIAEGEAVRITQRNPKTLDGINVEGANHVVVDGFVIEGMPRAGIRLTHSKQSVVRRVRADKNRNCGIFTSFCDDILIERNTTSNSLKEHGIYVSNSGDRPVIRHNLVFGNRSAGIQLNGDSSQGGDGLISEALIENNVIHDNGIGDASGINCDGVQNSMIRNNLLYNNFASGISLFRIDGAAGSTGNRVINNTIVQPSKSRWAVNIKNQSTKNLIVNNILINKGPRGSINVSTDSLSGLTGDYNIVDGRFSPDDGERIMSLGAWNAATGLDSHSQVSKPEHLFIDEPSADHHLRNGSPAIDAGDGELAPRVDIEATARPAGPRPDIGAYEAKEGMAGAKGSTISSLPLFFVAALLLVSAAALSAWYYRLALWRLFTRVRVSTRLAVSTRQ